MSAPSSSATKSSPRMPDGSRRSSQLQDTGESTPDSKPKFQPYSTSGRHTSFPHPEYMQPLQTSQMMPMQDPSFAATSRPPTYKEDQNQESPMTALHPGGSEPESGMPNPMQYGYFGAPASLASSYSAPSGLGSAQWPSFSSQYSVPDFGRSVYTTMPPSTTFSSEAVTGIPSAQLTYESPSSTNASPTRTSSYYDMSSGPFQHSNLPQYAFNEGASSSDGSNPYGMMASPQFQGTDIDGMLEQVSKLYKTANTKKMAEFYRDKWARMWLTCNYTLKPSIQISIPRTILHESYRQACESFSVEPLQAASFGKVLRSQFPDVAQRRLGGRGKTRFHYCGFGTSTEREALKVKSLLEDEKAGRLQLSAGMSSEFSSVSKAKAKSEGHDPSSSSSSHVAYDDPHNEGGSRSFSFASTSSHSSSGHHPQAKDLAASAFATLNSSTSTPSAESAGHHASHLQQLHPQHQLQASTSGQGGAIPRRHTVSHAQSFSNLPDMSFLSDMNFQAYPMSAAAEHGYSSEGQTGDQSSLASQLNSPASSLLGYTHGYSSQSPHQMRLQRPCRELPDWPRVEETGQASSAATGSTTLSPNARKAWREYEALCQDLLHYVYQGPDLTSFEQRIISFWSSVNPSTHDALHREPLLSTIMLQADEIVFRQLLTRLDETIGDDVPADKTSSIQELSLTLSNKIRGLVKDVLSEASILAKIRSLKSVADSLERIAKIFEAVKAFRDNAMLDVGSYWQQAGSASVSLPSNDFLATVEEPHSMASAYTLPADPSHGVVGTQYRQRDESLGSNASNSYPWLHGEDAASSSASELGIENPPTHIRPSGMTEGTQVQPASTRSDSVSKASGLAGLALTSPTQPSKSAR